MGCSPFVLQVGASGIEPLGGHGAGVEDDAVTHLHLGDLGQGLVQKGRRQALRQHVDVDGRAARGTFSGQVEQDASLQDEPVPVGALGDPGKESFQDEHHLGMMRSHSGAGLVPDFGEDALGAQWVGLSGHCRIASR